MTRSPLPFRACTALLALAFALASCGLQPMYAGGSTGAVARGLAQALGVSLTAQDTPGGGLTMVIGIPRTPRPAVVTPEGGGSA